MLPVLSKSEKRDAKVLLYDLGLLVSYSRNSSKTPPKHYAQKGRKSNRIRIPIHPGLRDKIDQVLPSLKPGNARIGIALEALLSHQLPECIVCGKQVRKYDGAFEKYCSITCSTADQNRILASIPKRPSKDLTSADRKRFQTLMAKHFKGVERPMAKVVFAKLYPLEPELISKVLALHEVVTIAFHIALGNIPYRAYCPECGTVVNPRSSKNWAQYCSPECGRVSSYLDKPVTLANGDTTTCQGYEEYALRKLEKLGRMPKPWAVHRKEFSYVEDGRLRSYRPDILCGDTFYEIKSSYTLFGSPDLYNNAKVKANAVLDSGFRIKVVVVDVYRYKPLFTFINIRDSYAKARKKYRERTGRILPKLTKQRTAGFR